LLIVCSLEGGGDQAFRAVITASSEVWFTGQYVANNVLLADRVLPMAWDNAAGVASPAMASTAPVRLKSCPMVRRSSGPNSAARTSQGVFGVGLPGSVAEDVGVAMQTHAELF